MLFGSRARGDERPDSDWDVMAVWDAVRPVVFAPFVSHEGAPVNWASASRTELLAGCHRGGSLARSVCAYGRVVWGEPIAVPGWQEARDMDMEVWVTRWNDCVVAAVAAAEAAADAESAPRPRPFDIDLQRASADFAERVAKLALKARGIAPGTSPRRCSTGAASAGRVASCADRRPERRHADKPCDRLRRNGSAGRPGAIDDQHGSVRARLGLASGTARRTACRSSTGVSRRRTWQRWNTAPRWRPDVGAGASRVRWKKRQSARGAR